MIGRETLILETNALFRDFFYLVVPNAEPSRAGAYEKSIHAHRINQWHQCRITKRADAPALQVKDFEAQKLRKIDKFFWHRLRMRTMLTLPHLNPTSRLPDKAGPSGR